MILRAFVDLSGLHRQCDEHLKTTTALPPFVVEDRCGRAALDARRHPLVTVEADPVLVEKRLASGQLTCPGCEESLRPWGWARAREVHGIAERLRPRRVRCAACLVTHVLLPVSVLLRRGYAAEVIGGVLRNSVEGRACWLHEEELRKRLSPHSRGILDDYLRSRPLQRAIPASSDSQMPLPLVS